MNDQFTSFLREFLYPAECAYEKEHYGDLNHVTWENVPGDDGKWTKWGIDWNSHRSLGVDGIKNMTIEQADAIYLDQFLKEKSGKLPYPLNYCYFDCSVNAGPGRANQFLVNNTDAKEYLNARGAWYHRLVAAKPKNKKFLQGWLNRIEDLKKYLKL